MDIKTISLPAWQKDVRELLERCQQACAVEDEYSSLIKTLKSFYQKLIDLRGSELMRQEDNEVSKTEVPYTNNNMVVQSTAIDKSKLNERDFLRHVAKELIYLDRVISSEEIEGTHRLDRFEYDNDCKWYIDMMKIISQKVISKEVDTNTLDIKNDLSTSSVDNQKDDIRCDHPERLIDECLDLCGYEISLEVAVECLRQIVHDSSASSRNSSSEGGKDNRMAATITCLRIVRRRLLLSSPSNNSATILEEKSILTIIPDPYKHAFLTLKNVLGIQSMKRIFECMILPLECHHNKQILHQTHEQGNKHNLALHETLSSIPTMIVPSLVSSACHAMKLPLPSWASPKTSYGILFHSAWKMVLAEYLLNMSTASGKNERSEVASDNFQQLVQQMITSGRTDIVVKHIYKCWKLCDTCNDDELDSAICSPQALLYRRLQSIIDSISSKREAAVFCRAVLRHSIKQEIPKSIINNYSRQEATNKCDEICERNVLPFLQEMLLPSLSNDKELVDAVVHYIILSPPTSFQCHQGISSLQVIDRAAPRCLARLLSLACVEYSFLFTVASVWCEDVFVERTDTLQQQYVTEFLLQPLESKQLSQDDLQKGLGEDGTALATLLVQGVTLRLETSRSESIRLDGMRVAESLASILGQHLQFDELHPPSVNNSDSDEDTDVIDKKKKPSHKKKQVLTPLIQVVDDGSGESSDDDTSQSSTSSWGEDSLQPYAMDDDEEDLRRVPIPRTLRECLAYLLVADNEDLAYDKHYAALSELTTIITSQPLDLLYVVSTLVRVLLFLEDKFSMDQYTVKRWDSLMAFGIAAPLETCMVLVREMKGNISLGTRLESLALLRGIAEELSGTASKPKLETTSNNNSIDQEIVACSTRLKLALNLNDTTNEEKKDESTELANTQSSKTRRWRKPRETTTTTTNKFGAVSVQMIYSLFCFLSQTKGDASIWSGANGERFLVEFLKTLAIMLHCARTYRSTALQVLATDLFDLAWSFHDANSSEVRYAALIAIAAIMPLLPIEFVMRHSQGMAVFLNQTSKLDQNVECRQLASLIVESIGDSMNGNMISERQS